MLRMRPRVSDVRAVLGRLGADQLEDIQGHHGLFSGLLHFPHIDTTVNHQPHFLHYGAIKLSNKNNFSGSILTIIVKL